MFSLRAQVPVWAVLLPGTMAAARLTRLRVSHGCRRTAVRLHRGATGMIACYVARMALHVHMDLATDPSDAVICEMTL